MKLLLDAGNTRLKWRLVMSGGCAHIGVHAWDGAIAALLAAIDVQHEKLQRVMLASVRSDLDNQLLIAALARVYDGEVALAKSEAVRLGVSNGYLEPERLGVDRWLALIAAYQQEARAQVVVSLGTAVTVDLLDAQGQHLGGYIAPSLGVFAGALNNATARINADVVQDGVRRAPGRTTSEAVTHAYCIMLEQLVREALDCLGDDACLVLSGGGAAWLASAFPGAKLVDDLVLSGLELYFSAAPTKNSLS